MSKDNIEEQEIPTSCPTCGNKIFHTDNSTGETICTVCGLVVSEQMAISRAKEWRNFDGEPSQDRATPITNPSLISGSSSHTRIAPWSNLDGQNKKLGAETKVEFLRLSRMNNRAMGDKATLARTISTARQLYTTYKYKLSIPDSVDEHIFDTFTKAVAANLIRSRSIQQILIACMYYSLRENGIPTTMDNIEAVTGIDRKDIARCYRLMVETMKMKPSRRDPAIFISQFGSKLNLTGEFELKAMALCHKAEAQKVTSGSSPLCIAACVIYLTAKQMDLNISQKTIASVCGVTEVSIRNHVRKFQRGNITFDD